MLEVVEKQGEDFLTVVFLACEQLQRGGVGCVATENGLVDVDAHAHDAVGDVLALQVALNQRSTDFLCTHINVIGPLHLHTFHILGEGLLNRHRHALGKQPLTGCQDKVRMAEQGKGQILALLRLPRITLLSSTFRLVVCHHQGETRQ